MSIKAAENASGDYPGASAYIRDGMNIPRGNNAEGGQEYLVDADLMHEPPMQMIRPNSLCESWSGVASRTHTSQAA
jgi:hypothetical protein